jgi:SAM-dependent methyltransferase
MEQPTNDLMAFFEYEFVQPKKGRTLVVGSKLYTGREDRRLRFPEAVGVDMLPGDGVDYMMNLEELSKDDFETLGKFDHVDCVSVLEHSSRPWLMAANLEKLLVPNGTIYLNVPFIWRVHAYPDDYFRYTAAGVRVLFPQIEWNVMKYVSSSINDSHKLGAMLNNMNGLPYLPRTSVLGFGAKKC